MVRLLGSEKGFRRRFAGGFTLGRGPLSGFDKALAGIDER
jgi:hypothetical protein